MLALILSRSPFREHDEHINVLSKTHGKLELVARGTKKITSKNAAQLEPFSLVEIDITQGKQLLYLLRAVPVKPHHQIRTRLDASLSAGYVMATLSSLLHAGAPEQKLFDQLAAWLSWLERGGNITLPVLDAVMLMILQHLGMAPQLDACVTSGVSYQQMVKDALAEKQPNPGLYPAGGGLVSAKQRIAKQQIGETVHECGLTEISNMQLLQTQNWQKIADANISAQEVLALHRLVFEYTLYHTEKGLKDWSSIVRLGK